MLTDDLLGMFRLQVNDVAKPTFSSDDEVYAWMNDAQTELFRRTNGIPDAITPAVCKLDVKAGTIYTATHPAITRYLQAFWTDGTGRTREIEFQNEESLGEMTRRDYGVQLSYANSTVPSDPRFAIIGLLDNTIKWSPPFRADETIMLTVYRLPITTISADGQTFECSQMHLINLLDWMAYRYYSKQDANTYDRTQAAEMEQRFINYCVRVKEEQERSKYKVRVVHYGGI